jgi:predicted GNAT superfamily acetyltransferase
MTIEIRPIQSHDEYRAVERLQRDVWRLEDVEVVPDHVLLTAQKNGGVLLGAFEGQPHGQEPQEQPRLVGFVFGFVGLTADDTLKHCSHMLGVAPEYRSQGLGYRLKLAQREQVLRQGIDLVTWTYDPLESRNAYLNFRKLGTTCSTYLRDLYGDMRDQLNAGLTSDRFRVDWHVASERVTRRLRDDWRGPSLWALLSAGVEILNRFSPGERPRPPQKVRPLGRDRLLIQIPADFQAIRAADMALARAWRAHTRALFEAAFAASYSVVDLLFESGRSCYLLRRDGEREDRTD